MVLHKAGHLQHIISLLVHIHFFTIRYFFRPLENKQLKTMNILKEMCYRGRRYCTTLQATIFETNTESLILSLKQDICAKQCQDAAMIL